MKLWEEINCNCLLAHSGGVAVLMLGLHVDKTQVKKLSLQLDCSVKAKNSGYIEINTRAFQILHVVGCHY